MTRTKWTAFALTALLTGLLASAAPAEAAKRRGARVTGKVNLNTAPAKQLQLLPRVGKKTAKAIVVYRVQHRFHSIRQVMKVKGIGKRTFLRIKRHLAVTGPNTLRKHRTKRQRKARGRKGRRVRR